ncbi:MAG: PorT family protein [Flavobacterium sp.]|nr:PorT family protein [Flavobacterium sp.]
MRRIAILITLFSFLPLLSQETDLPTLQVVDSLYREDQFYIGITYNMISQQPKELEHNKVSLGFSIGFLRDMPFNEKRTWSVAAGLGYSVNTSNQNLLIDKAGDQYNYSYFPSNLSYDKNKLILNYIDVPIELRWRTSTYESHRFWRIYTGFKLSYLFHDTYKFRSDDGDRTITNNPDLNKIQYGAYLAMGYNTWNFYAYYGINPMYKSAEVNAEKLDPHILNLGLMFYIL